MLVSRVLPHDIAKNALGGDGSINQQNIKTPFKVSSPSDVAMIFYRGAVKRKKLMVLSKPDWRRPFCSRGLFPGPVSSAAGCCPDFQAQAATLARG